MAVPTLVATAAAGIVFGFAVAAPPGPMNAIIAEESVLRGWSAGFRAGLGAMTADACFLVLALLGAITFVETYPTVRAAMVAVGGLLMWYFAYGAARNAGASATTSTEPTTSDRGRFEEPSPIGAIENRNGNGNGNRVETARTSRTGFKKAFVLAITNPFQVVFWLTVGLSLLDSGRFDVFGELPYVGAVLAGRFIVETGSPLLLVGFFGGIALWITGFPAALIAARNRSAAVAPVVTYLSAGVLAVFGTVFLFDAIGTLGATV